MKVRYLILANYAEFTIDGRVNIIGGDYDKIFYYEFPSIQAGIFLTGKLIVGLEEMRNSHEAVLEIVDDQGERIHEEIRQSFDPIFSEELFKRNEATIAILINFQNVLFTKEGDYRISMSWDGAECATLPLGVVQKPNPEQAIG